jgi:hypothetical protein
VAEEPGRQEVEVDSLGEVAEVWELDDTVQIWDGSQTPHVAANAAVRTRHNSQR